MLHFKTDLSFAHVIWAWPALLIIKNTLVVVSKVAMYPLRLTSL